EYGETLILLGRNNPFVTELPDIDEYKFENYPPYKTDNRSLPLIVRYDVNKVMDAIKNNKRPLPFSTEVYGEEKYYKDISPKSEPKSRNDIFDW
ncbi:MAG: hypothetical protein FWF29_08950, partial [Treponema sp.]|nr:hypothetical protein [Treponema sp.]